MARPGRAVADARSCTARARPPWSSTAGCSSATVDRSMRVDSDRACSRRSTSSGAALSRSSSRSRRAARTYCNAPSWSRSARSARSRPSSCTSSSSSRVRSSSSPLIAATPRALDPRQPDGCDSDAREHERLQEHRSPGLVVGRVRQHAVGQEHGDRRHHHGDAHGRSQLRRGEHRQEEATDDQHVRRPADVGLGVGDEGQDGDDQQVGQQTQPPPADHVPTAGPRPPGECDGADAVDEEDGVERGLVVVRWEQQHRQQEEGDERGAQQHLESHSSTGMLHDGGAEVHDGTPWQKPRLECAW